MTPDTTQPSPMDTYPSKLKVPPTLERGQTITHRQMFKQTLSLSQMFRKYTTAAEPNRYLLFTTSRRREHKGVKREQSYDFEQRSCERYRCRNTALTVISVLNSCELPQRLSLACKCRGAGAPSPTSKTRRRTQTARRSTASTRSSPRRRPAPSFASLPQPRSTLAPETLNAFPAVT